MIERMNLTKERDCMKYCNKCKREFETEEDTCPIGGATAMWSVYDKWMRRFVIIGASLTD